MISSLTSLVTSGQNYADDSKTLFIELNGYTFRGINSAIFIFASLLSGGHL